MYAITSVLTPSGIGKVHGQCIVASSDSASSIAPSTHAGSVASGYKVDIWVHHLWGVDGVFLQIDRYNRSNASSYSRRIPRSSLKSSRFCILCITYTIPIVEHLWTHISGFAQPCFRSLLESLEARSSAFGAQSKVEDGSCRPWMQYRFSSKRREVETLILQKRTRRTRKRNFLLASNRFYRTQNTVQLDSRASTTNWFVR